MNYSTQYEYRPEVLEKVAEFCHYWDQHLTHLHPRKEKSLFNERHLYLQYMFIHQVPDPLKPSLEIILRWLKPSEGFSTHTLRLILLERLFKFTSHSTFSNFRPPKKVSDTFELIFWHSYHKRIFKRSRDTFNRILTRDIVDAELKLWPFYHSMDLYQEKNDSYVEDFFEESHQEVVEIVGHLISKKPVRILDIGCGDGRLLLNFKQKFPEAELYATNFFETTGISKELTEYQRFILKVCTVEEMDFPDEYFDVIVSTEVIEHLRDPKVMVEKIQRHLKTGGAFVVTAPSVHTRFLTRNPLTYIEGALSTVFEKILPPFHQLYEAMTDLPIVHYAFSYKEFQQIFSSRFKEVEIKTMRFTHLRKFKLHRIASALPCLKKFGGLVVAFGKKTLL